MLQRQLAAAGLAGAEIMTVDSLSAHKRLAEAGFGLSLLPHSSIDEELELGTLKLLKVPTAERLGAPHSARKTGW